MRNTNDDFALIMDGSHYWNWRPDWDITQKVYEQFPDDYSVLTPFAYAYLEELIRSTTSEYGMSLLDNDGNPKKRKVGINLITLAINENSSNTDYVNYLEKIKSYFISSKPQDKGRNRNNVVHGYMHASYWDKDSFEQLIHDAAALSKYSGF